MNLGQADAGSTLAVGSLPPGFVGVGQAVNRAGNQHVDAAGFGDDDFDKRGFGPFSLQKHK